MRKGFSLVELSVVLVIIGLLVGGILAGKSLIRSSKISGVAAQIQKFDSSVAAFKTEYKYLPGDAPLFGGDGNGVISVNEAQGRWAHIFGCEVANFWNNLMPESYTNTYTCPNPSGTPILLNTTGKNVPTSKLGTNSFFAASSLANGSAFADLTNKRNYYSIQANPRTAVDGYGNWSFTTTTATNSAVKPAELQALDIKIDDGVANNGNVLSGSIANSGGTSGGVNETPVSGYCSNNANYLPNTGLECTPIIRIGGQTSDLQ